MGAVSAASAFPVTDNGGSLTVDGPLTSAQLVALEPLAVTGPLTDTQLRATPVPVGDGGGSLTVDGPLTSAQLVAAEPLAVSVGNFPASQPVTGPLTDAELRATPVEVDGSATTQPVSVDELPLPDGAATDGTLSEVALTAILEREALAVK